MTEKPRVKSGRPPKPQNQMKQVAIRLPVELIRDLDNMAAEMAERTSIFSGERSALIRSLLVDAVAAHKKGCATIE